MRRSPAGAHHGAPIPCPRALPFPRPVAGVRLRVTALSCELTWRTPDDRDEHDSGQGAGSDLDLHFAHPDAGGPDLDRDGRPDGWFDIPWDVFWFNRNPEWGSMNPAVNP